MKPLLAVLRNEGERTELCAPQVGVFRTHLRAGDEIHEGSVLGTLVVLARRYEVVAPAGVSAVVATDPLGGRQGKGYGDPLLELTDHTAHRAPEASTSPSADAQTAPVDGRSIHAPIDGIFYARSSPEAPPYVQVGDRVSQGQVVGLIEVMKTFNPIRYEFTDGREATVSRIDVEDQQEVTSGQQLLILQVD
ncbi:MAG TPA: hypothetical protein DIU15_07345 [Deltaproteobacteria bacterium]|nr:hypothetical protein [Deltaproteobacteria bacterium]HCP45839.1 hypothetical protein [Deltaproteobacteria bacterium]